MTLTVRQVVRKFRKDAPRIAAEIDQLVRDHPENVGWFDQVHAAEEDLFSRMFRAWLTSPLFVGKELMLGSLPPEDRVLAMIAMWTAIGQRGNITWCEHVQDPGGAPQPVYVMLAARVGMCGPCLKDNHTRLVAEWSDDGHCDFCQHEAVVFTSIQHQIGPVYLSGDYCNDCESGWATIMGRNPQ